MRGEFFSETRLYGGHEHERDLFGTFETDDPRFRATMQTISEGRVERYRTFRESVDDVKRFTKDDPANPRQRFLDDLRIEVAERLGIDPDDVLAYGSVGTPLDVLHGTDAFLSIWNKGKETIVTLDASLRDKLETKADLMIGEIPDAEEDEDGYLKAIESLAGQVASAARENERLTGTYG